MKFGVFGVVLISIVSFLGCYQTERNCSQFHTGTFEFQSYINGELVTTQFERSDSLEIDHFRGKSDTSSIRWVNDCEFIVKAIHPKNRAEQKPIHMRILSTDGDTYEFEYGLVGSTKKQKGTAKKIH